MGRSDAADSRTAAIQYVQSPRRPSTDSSSWASSSSDSDDSSGSGLSDIVKEVMAEHGVPGRAEGHRAAADADAAAAVCHQCLPRPRAPIGCVYGVVCASCLEYFVRCVRVLAFAVVPTKREAFDFYLSMKKSVKEGEKAVLSGERRRARYVAPGRFLSDYAWAASGNTLDAGHTHWTAKVTADPRFSGDIKPAVRK